MGQTDAALRSNRVIGLFICDTLVTYCMQMLVFDGTNVSILVFNIRCFVLMVLIYSCALKTLSYNSFRDFICYSTSPEHIKQDNLDTETFEYRNI